MTTRWGILSTAHIATKVAKAIERAHGATAVAVASRSMEKAKAWADKHGIPKAHGSYQALLEDPEIDAVYIPLPPALHREWVLQAAQYGKHILCEKPLAKNTAESIEMVEVCRKAGVQLMDGVMWVHHDRSDRMKQDLSRLGKLRRVTASFSFCWDVIPEKNIRLDPALAGGCLGDLGYYCARAIWWAYGELPSKVYATARYVNDVEMNLSAMLWFSDERMASFDCGFDTQMRQWLEVAGTRGSLVCDDFVLPWSESKARWWLHDGTGRGEERSVPDCVQEVRMIEHFSELVRTGVLEARWPNETVTTMRICDALAQSARQNMPIDLPG